MEKITEIDRYFEGNFKLVDFHRSFRQLLIRHSKFVDGNNVNFDIRFDGVHYVELPDIWSGMHITNGLKEDWKYIATRYNKDLYRQMEHLFKITSENKTYYVLAYYLCIDNNTLFPDQTSLH